METIGMRIKWARGKRGMTRPELAEKSGVPYATLAGIENDDQTSSTRLPAIARALLARIEWLENGKGDWEAAEYSDPDWPDVTGHKVAASLGAGAIPDEYAETHKLKFRADSLRKKHLNPAKLGVVYGSGDSGLPRIHDGDAILFDRADVEPLRDGKLYVISYDGTLLAKKLVQLGGRWFIQSINPADPTFGKPQPVDAYKHFAVHGRVRWVGSWEE